jgi:hypothetical protein
MKHLRDVKCVLIVINLIVLQFFMVKLLRAYGGCLGRERR